MKGNVMEEQKIKVAVELKNGNYHKITECSTIEFNKGYITIYSKDLDLTINYEDIELFSIYVDNPKDKEHLTFKSCREPKVVRD